MVNDINWSRLHGLHQKCMQSFHFAVFGENVYLRVLAQGLFVAALFQAQKQTPPLFWTCLVRLDFTVQVRLGSVPSAGVKLRVRTLLFLATFPCWLKKKQTSKFPVTCCRAQP